MGGYDLSEMDLQELKQVDVRTVNPDTLVDIKEIEIDRTLPKGERIQEFIRQIRNPYCFRVGDMGVKLEFLDSAPPLEDCFTDFLQRKKSGL